MTNLKSIVEPSTSDASTSVDNHGPDRTVPAAEKVLEGILKHYRPLAGHVRAKGECLRLIGGNGPDVIQHALAKLPSEWADHSIACVYAILMAHSRRKALGAYFTPPHLVDHLLARMTQQGLDIAKHRILDPAAGGAAFLVPLARRMVEIWRNQNLSDYRIIGLLRKRLIGIEIDQGLGEIANALLRRMLVQEWNFWPSLVRDLQIIQKADALSKRPKFEKPDHEVGNPPYRRLSAGEHGAMFKRFGDIASGRLNLYAIFMRRALQDVPPGGLIGHIVPASFLGGPEFSTFRRRLLQLADVLTVDLVDQRSQVFVDAIQDACFVVLRRRHQALIDEEGQAVSGILHADGHFTASADMRLAFDGSPWLLPGPKGKFNATLEDWGYRPRIGYVVPHRQPERLFDAPGAGRYPLIWAKAAGQDGTFDHLRGASGTRQGWVSAPADASYVVREPCVIVQRTSSRDQRKRVVAAAVPKEFMALHKGIVGENHVLLLVQSRPDAASSEALAAALNNPEVSQAMDRICGSASIPVGAILTLRLPPP